jgi:PAS domain S-box-containing protein
MAEHSEYELEPFRTEGEFTHYRGRESGSQRPVLAVAVAEQPSPQSLRRLEHEYGLATELDAAWAAQPLALTRYQGRSILILTDPSGESLDRIIEQHREHPIGLDRFLRIALSLASAVGQAHGRGLIHRDIKPAKVLVDAAGQVWLTGFGMASRLVRERLTPAAPEVIAGTLAYMSPEQTGRMNRSMDARSDLYSLGVTLYQVLTGVLPFTAVDPLEWVHCHVARQPMAPIDRREVPEPLSAIIMKLLAKNAEERYQTAAGLEADLRRCLADWQTLGRIDPFPLGAEDSSDSLLIPEKLYGRGREVDALLAAFDRMVAQGTAELVLVSGYSGVGKSSVVNELHKVLVPPRGLFAAGKFDQYKRDVPYATLAQAFQTLVRQILVKSEAELDHWRRAFLEALGPNGQLLIDLIPEVEFIIGKQSRVAELPPQEARGRFQLVFRRFLGAFARPEHPLALFLDDLQWLDTATLELLEHLATDPDVRHVLLIGAYRDNEVSSSHPLMRTLSAIREAGAKVHEIVLVPLRLHDVEQLVADALHCSRRSAAPLALLVHEKTGGNPFFVIQLLSSLAEEELLRFDRSASGWTCDLDRIRSKRYSGNVVDLMLAKLRRLPQPTQTALQQLACLGNVAEMELLSAGFGQAEERIHTLLWEAVRAGLVLRLEGSYAFPHDRIQEAAYALIPPGAGAEIHLRIGRSLLASLPPDGLTEHVFDVANQLNRGTALLIDHDEKVNVAAIDLKAGRKAKASAAYAAALTYFTTGLELLDERDWSSEYEMTFSLSLESAECELLTGHLDRAEALIEQLLPRAVSKVDSAAVYCLKVQLHVIKSEHRQAVTTALMCLREFDIDLPEHPTEQDIQAESDAVSHALNGRSIESLIDLPLMTDPNSLAAMRVLSFLSMSAQFTDLRLCCLQACRVVNLSLRHGISGDSASTYGFWGSLLGFVFPRYREGYLFSKLACDLVEKHSFVANRAPVLVRLAYAAGFTQSLESAIESSRRSITAGIETGSPVWANYGLFLSLTYRLLRGDPLDLVWHESEMALEVAQKARYEDAVAVFTGEQRFIATMRGGTAVFSTYNDAEFDEAAFETQTTRDRAPIVMGQYWVLKLMARLLSNDYAEALVAAEKAKPLLGAIMLPEPRLNYFYCAALTVAALYESASAEQQQAWRELLGEHQKQLREWAENYPPTFADKLALVSAEIARIEGRDADALPLYEEAIHLARENGFVQYEGLASELTARYYLAHRLETAGYAHLRNARNCYDRWGAHEKVKQLDERYPRLREGQTLPAPPAIGQFDVETVVKASQALSSEVVLPELIEKLVRIAMEHAGAERGLLILVRDDALRIEAEATTGVGRIDVVVRQTLIAPHDLLLSALNYVIRTRERVLLDDASSDKVYSKDEYVQLKRSRSVLCLPIVKQAKLIGALYLENNLTPYAFTPDRVAVLELLASQAAISLENAALYTDLQLQVDILQQLPVSAWTLKPDGTPDFVNQVWLEFSGQILDFVRSHPEAWMSAVHPDDRALAAKSFWEGVHSGKGFAMETRNLRALDGTYRWNLNQAVVLRDSEGRVLKFVGTSTDIDDQKRTEEALRQAQDDLARINRVTTMGELAASLAHELNQPISGALTNVDVCLRKLARDKPDLDGVRAAITRLARDTRRAADIMGRVRSQFKRGALSRELVDVNELHQETVALLRDEAMRYKISVRTELTTGIPQILGDRVQLQQVAMNLIVNSIEATKDVDRKREIEIKSQRTDDDQVLVSISDTGIGFLPELGERIFEPFFTTKSGGTGMGLRICRSIVESHGGRLWAVGAPGRGAIFHVSLPAAIAGPA